MKSLWSGLSPTLVLAVPATICYFVSYEGTRLYMKDLYQKYNPGITVKVDSTCIDFLTRFCFLFSRSNGTTIRNSFISRNGSSCIFSIGCESIRINQNENAITEA